MWLKCSSSHVYLAVLFQVRRQGHKVMPSSGTRHGRPLAPLWKRENCFCAVALTTKRSAYKLFMHYLHYSSASGPPPPSDLHWGSLHEPHWGTFVPIPLICLPLEKILQASMSQDGLCVLNVEFKCGWNVCLVNVVLEMILHCRFQELTWPHEAQIQKNL